MPLNSVAFLALRLKRLVCVMCRHQSPSHCLRVFHLVASCAHYHCICEVIGYWSKQFVCAVLSGYFTEVSVCGKLYGKKLLKEIMIEIKNPTKWTERCVIVVLLLVIFWNSNSLKLWLKSKKQENICFCCCKTKTEKKHNLTAVRKTLKPEAGR